MSDKTFKKYQEQHSEGFVSIESLPDLGAKSDLGIQISEDGKVWICINGVAFLRFKPEAKNIPVIDLDEEAWKQIKEAAKNSLWIPEQYMMNDWISDVCNFLRYGPE